MSSAWRSLLAALACLWLGAWAGVAAAQVVVPPLTGAVVDLTGTLSADQQRSLDAELRAFSEQRGSQIAVLLVPTTQPEAIEQFSIRVAEAWKIGRRKIDDGAILVIAKNDRAVRIEVGYGLEGAIPDAVAKRIVEERITPRFREGDFYGGIKAATDTLMKLVQGEKLPEPARRSVGAADSSDHLQWLIWVLFAVFMFGGVVRAIFGRTFGSLLTGGVVGAVAALAIGSILVGVVAGLFAFLVALASGGSRGPFIGGPRGGGWGGGGFGGGGWGGGSGGGFGGGGGGFGGGGASGRW